MRENLQNLLNGAAALLIKKINVKFVRSEVIRDDVYTNKYQVSMT